MDIQSKKITNCPLDENCNWEFLYNSTFHNYNLPIYKCKNCGLQTIHPKPKSLKAIYDENYYSGSSNYSYKDERKTEKFDSFVWDARLKNIQKFVKSGNFLDVGSSFGGFLERAKKFGFTPYGIEISPYSAKYCQDRNIETFQGEFLDSKFPNHFFDVITLIEVIEHLDKPKEVFQKLFDLLKKDGLLVIQTANFEGWQAISAGASYHYYLPGHLFYYSESNLKKILTKNGFSKFYSFFGVDFPLLAKLQKSRGSFSKLTDYLTWFRISFYHFKSKIRLNNKSLTSSLVLYAVK
ncbi:MAG: class I SAM-dependent methyltransferase [Leptospiraceae bacterium]|nr:class I SAM-dependent methyltransferase [Leptospiraceae bacterium]